MQYPATSIFNVSEAHNILETLLLPHEKILHMAAISPFVYWKAGIMALIAVCTLLVSVNLAIYLFLISLALFLFAFSARKYLLLAATDQRLIISAGILNATVTQFSYDSIESIELSSLLLGQFFGYASVIVSGNGRRRLIIPYVENAMDFADGVTQKIRERKSR